MVTKSLIVVLGLLAMVDRSLALTCEPCPNPSDCGPPPTCSFGLARSSCSCCGNNICAKGPGEQCGGPWNFGGTCGIGLECQYQYKEWFADGSGTFPADNSPGLCSNKSGPGEQCGGRSSIGGGWNDYGTCESGLECQQKDQKDDRRILPPGICSNSKILVTQQSTLVADGCKDDLSLYCAFNAYQCNTNTDVQGLCRKTCGLCGVASANMTTLRDRKVEESIKKIKKEVDNLHGLLVQIAITYYEQDQQRTYGHVAITSVNEANQDAIEAHPSFQFDPAVLTGADSLPPPHVMDHNYTHKDAQRPLSICNIIGC